MSSYTACFGATSTFSLMGDVVAGLAAVINLSRGLSLLPAASLFSLFSCQLRAFSDKEKTKSDVAGSSYFSTIRRSCTSPRFGHTRFMIVRRLERCKCKAYPRKVRMKNITIAKHIKKMSKPFEIVVAVPDGLFALLPPAGLGESVGIGVGNPPSTFTAGPVKSAVVTDDAL